MLIERVKSNNSFFKSMAILTQELLNQSQTNHMENMLDKKDPPVSNILVIFTIFKIVISCPLVILTVEAAPKPKTRLGPGRTVDQ